MTTQALPKKHDHLVVFAGEGINGGAQPQLSVFERDGKKVLGIKDVPVFRSGNFRDSMGFPHEYDGEAMRLMVSNFDHLRAQKIFSDVPVRNGHPSPFRSRMQELVGYVVGLRTEDRTAPHDGNVYTYLLAEFEILDESAQEKIESGLWRNRSSEIGVYHDNREIEYAPAFLGVAYVDIPAVEGLNGFSKDENDDVHFIMEDNMSGAITPPLPKGNEPFSFTLGKQNGITDGAAVQEYINQIENENEKFTKQVTDLTTENTALKEFQTKVITAEREDFVSSLIDGGKVLASKKDSLIALAKGLNEDQFEAWKDSFEDTPAKEILGSYGNQESNKPAAGSEPSAEEIAESEFEANKRVVSALANSGMSLDNVKATTAYKSVVAHDSTFTL
ncbi:head maturation protease [Gordonia phage GordDuk1]|uniref:Capsid maturation protease n=1 Tax=Gordonia phage GordDuk1 TaxID=1622191 RepID=A0A0E3X9U9_9CAUD|nr:head maturation protease [Gordonia phage GordDuk1]AKC02933.1 hypothetical protein GordDuk1_5 [Gordonia phage GordDuk1]